MAARRVVKKKLASLALVGGLLLNSCSMFDISLYTGLEERIKKDVLEPTDGTSKYGIILNGSDEEADIPDIALAYQIMLENGFSAGNIYILSNGTKEYETHFYPKDDIFSKESLEILLNHMSNKIDENDILVAYLINHAEPEDMEKDGNIVKTGVQDEYIHPKDMHGYFSKIKPKFGILILNTCYAGGFARPLGIGNYIAISSSDLDHKSYRGHGKNFGGLFFLAYREREEADKNFDNRISVKEAYNFAKSKMPRPEDNPQMIFDEKIKPGQVFIE